MKIYIVDDDEPVRRALSLLARSEGLESESFASGTAFLAAIDAIESDALSGCLLLDVCMPDFSGLELQHELTRRGVQIPVIVITGHGDVPTAVQAMKGGALDFVEKPLDVDDLLLRIRSCLSGESARRQTAQGQQEACRRVGLLTPREREVMAGIVAGLRNKEIARKLSISFRTVELHRAKVMEKLDARSPSDVVRIALLSKEDQAAP
jgi:two-component system, LuxR family, response regulator FixJ